METMMKEISEDLSDNLRRIKELGDRLAFPYALTATKEELFSPNKKKGIITPIFKEEAFAIITVDLEEGFIHEKHFHKEIETLCLLEGSAIIYFDHAIISMQVNQPVIIPSCQAHEVHYHKKSRMLVTTIPASEEFPNAPRI